MIVFSTRRKILRRVIVAEADWHYTVVHQVLPGESYLLIPSGNNDGPERWGEHVFNTTGVRPPCSRCAVVRDGVVVNLVHADPDLDVHPDGDLVHLGERPARIGDPIQAEIA